MWRLLSDVSPPRKTVQFYTGLSQQIHKTFSCKTYSGDSDGRHCSTDTQTSLHPSCTTTQRPPSQRASGAPLLPRAHASWSEGEGPYNPRCCGCLQPPQAHTLSKFLQLLPGFFVSGKNQAAKTTNLCPQYPKNPLQYSRCFNRDIQLHMSNFEPQHTLQECASDTGCRTQSSPLGFAYDVFASLTAGRLSKLCFCVCFKTCIQLDIIQNRVILPFYHYN